ncbi:hypothetical protein D0B54_11310 [Solimonas sp. K1W22B-7]|uniref:hypothetical protein n=1 Tax=Solimonas sp. K1W22B-7 TaxID=2303331 RepID=UPI000E337B96|nr:hypothetical protein [Solimonas sp. K1W22B-7]AXQ29240.1 hypothetical protein D0B54_11310 [Solimonas sp. K1W22B-7]
MFKLETATRVALAVLLIYAGYLVMLAGSLPREIFAPLFSEKGPFEQMSIVLWLALGSVLLFHDFRSPKVLPLALLAFVFAAREADMHKAFTVMSIEKIKFYLSPDVPVMQKLIGGLVLLSVAGLVVFLARQFYLFFVRRDGARTPVGQVLLLPVLMLPIAKVLDRGANVLKESFGIHLPATVGQFNAAFEEGMEMAIPVLFIVALLLYRASQRGEQSLPAPVLTPGKR